MIVCVVMGLDRCIIGLCVETGASLLEVEGEREENE